MSQVFRYAIDKKFFPLWLPFGVRPSKDGVTITDDGRFVATYGFIRIETPMNNIDGAHVTSGYRWWTAIGARRSLVDDGSPSARTTRPVYAFTFTRGSAAFCDVRATPR
jgi:hypothetical protein